ncbi:hypothetical protein CPB86DRAFT_559037 [Serendipita vermifera]|nr:hypothetical protein CPB86DRAFT_559037 [Serendipita vermifera]
MAAPPRGYTSGRNHPPRAAPPSAISTSSSTSSNATVRPQATTPRATSPTSGQIPLPAVQHNYINRPTSLSNGDPTQQTFKAAPLGRHPHWGDPAMLAQDIARLDEKTVLDGLKLRTQQTLDVHPPYGLIIPDMVNVARQDMHICAPALDMLLSATLADGDPPVCEIPFIQADASGAQYADYTVPITAKNSPELLKSLFTTWTNVAQQIQALEPQFHSEIARIICELDPSQNILVPQVMRLAADCKNMATEISLRRTFLDRFNEALLKALKESEGSTIIGPPGSYRRALPDIGEAEEPPSSSSSSRSSSRASRRSRSRAHAATKAHSQAPWESSRHPNRPHPSGGLLSRSSSSSSLRLDKHGVPLEEAEYSDAHLVEPGLFSKTAISGAMPRREDDHISANGAHPNSAHSVSLRKQMDQYSSISPLTIPAYTTNELPSHVNASEKPIMPAEEPNLATDFPSNTDMLPNPRLDLPSSTAAASFFGARVLAKPVSTSLPNIVVPEVASSAMKNRGPRPLPQRPTRSPVPEQLPIQPPATVASTSAAPPQPIYTPFIVPDQGSSYPREPHHVASTADVQPFATFVVPSELPDLAEVPSASDSDVDLQAARDRYITESASSLPYYHHRRHGSSSREDVSQSMEHVRHQFQNMSISSTSHHPQVYHSIPEHGHEPNLPHVPSSSARRPGAGESNWISPSSWNDPPQGSTEPPVPPKDTSLFSNVKSWISRNHEVNSSKSRSQKPPSPPNKEAAYSQEIRIDSSTNPATHGSTPFTPPDSALAYYYGFTVPSAAPVPQPNGIPSSVPSGNLQDDSAYGGVSYVQSVPSQATMANSSHPGYDPRGVIDPRLSPGFAEAFQANPIEASRYYGASSSGRAGTADRTYHVDRRSEDRPSFSSNNSINTAAAAAMTNTSSTTTSNGDVDTVRETMYAAIADSLVTQNLRQVMLKDPHRAYFSAVSLAILNVSVTLQPQSTDSPNLVTMMGRTIRISDLPGAYKTCVAELATIGREARKLHEEDDERAIAYVARGKPLPEPRIGRVRKLLERGVGYVGADGRVRGTSSSGGGTGRSREFSNKINALSVELMKLAAFQEDMLRILVA